MSEKIVRALPAPKKIGGKIKKKSLMKKYPRLRDVRNVTLLSIMAVVSTQAITNAKLIKVMASDWVFGIQQTLSPQSSINITQKDNQGISANDIEKLLASSNTAIRKTPNLAPTIEEKLSDKQKKYKFAYNTLPPINKITIGSVGIDVPIVNVFMKNSEKVMEGDFDEELNGGVATYPGTAEPGTKGHSFIFGHSSLERRKGNKYSTVFAGIGKLKAGDTFTVARNGKLLTYRVKEQVVKQPNKVIDVYKKRNNTKTNHLSLVTCRPLGTDKKRMVITSELVDNQKKSNALITYQPSKQGKSHY